MVSAGTALIHQQSQTARQRGLGPEKPPRVSVGVPVYNGARYLAAALDSLLSQTFSDLEILVSDNGSNDGTEAICRMYADRDPRVRYFRENVNRGLAWNFNRVVELARGEYFKWAACDDLCAPSFVERCVELLDRHPDVAWCHSQTSYIDSSGDPLSGAVPLAFLSHPSVRRLDSVAADEPWTRASSRVHERFYSVMAGPAEVYDLYGLFRTEALKRSGLHRPFYGSDRVLLAEMSLVGRYAEIAEPLFFARRHPEQTVFSGRTNIERATTGRLTQRWYLPRRLRVTASMLLLALQARLGLSWRLKCLGAVALFTLSPAKWRRLAIDALRAIGFPLAVPEDKVREAAFARPFSARAEVSAKCPAGGPGEFHAGTTV